MHSFSVRPKHTSWRTHATKISFTMLSPIIRAVIPVIIRTVANAPRPGMVRTKPSSRERSPTTTRAKNRSDGRMDCRSARGHAQDPAIKEESNREESDAANKHGCFFEGRTDQSQRCVFARKNDDRGKHHPDDAFADDQPRGEQDPELLRRIRPCRAIRGAVKEPAGNRADHNHQRALRWEIYSKSDSERRNAHVFR